MRDQSGPGLRTQQGLIGLQIIGSVAAQFFLYHIGTKYFSNVGPVSSAAGDRLAFVLQWNVLGLCVLAAMILSIAARRPLSVDVIDGNDRAERLAVQVRIQRNTLEQFVWMVFGHLALALALPIDAFAVIPTYALMFIVFRILFWIGYTIRPYFRTFGFVGTLYPNVVMLVWAVQLTFFNG